MAPAAGRCRTYTHSGPVRAHWVDPVRAHWVGPVRAH